MSLPNVVPLSVTKCIENGPNGKQSLDRPVPLTSVNLISPANECGPNKRVKLAIDVFLPPTPALAKERENQRECPNTVTCS